MSGAARPGGRPRDVVCVRDARSLLDVWQRLEALEAEGARFVVRGAEDLEDLLPLAWRSDLHEMTGPPRTVWLADRSWSSLRRALGSGAWRWRALPRPAGGPTPVVGPSVPGDAVRWARERLDRAGRPAGAVLVAFAPGRGRVEGWVELIREVRRRCPSSGPIVLTQPRDLWTAVRIHEGVARAAPVLGPEADRVQIAALLKRVEVLVAAPGDLLSMGRLLSGRCLEWTPASRFGGRGVRGPGEVAGEIQRILEGKAEPGSA